MANRFFSPNQQFADATGLPYGTGSLTFYASGTSTPLATYSNRSLTTPNLNPLLLDSAGRAGDVFLQNLAYKVVLCSDPLGLVTIWTADPVYASDFSTVASFQSGAGSPNGVVAGSAGSPTVPASVYWDTTNNILYVATTTGTASTTVWTAVNASSSAAVVPAPQGYLTLTTGVPIIPADVTAATSVFYTPYVGNTVPIYNGSSLIPTVFTELQLTLNAAHVASNIYDMFVFNNSGVPTVVTGPSWSAGTGGNITAGSCARGTGAGGTSLTRLNGILTNAVQITGRNGVTTYTINANLATYIGSLFMDGTNGQITCHRSYGQSRKWGVWNAFNRQSIYLKAGDSTASWNYALATIRAANGNSANSLTIFSGLAEEIYRTDAFATAGSNTTTANNTTNQVNGIGYNSTTARSGFSTLNSLNAVTSNFIFASAMVSKYVAPPALGINVITALEAVNSPSTAGFNGTESSHLLTAEWRG